MNYIEYKFTCKPLEPAQDILIAQLSEVGFNSFAENKLDLLAYIPIDFYKENILENINILKSKNFDITHTKKEIKQENWNIKWESNFRHIVVDNRCAIRASFHDTIPNVDFDILINPKMSFGTGHHETTYMMIQYLLDMNLKDKRVLDMGCGTAILGILAEKKGANYTDAVDNDPWCVENGQENINLNGCKNINIHLGNASFLNDKTTYDLIIANINRNILLKNAYSYISHLSDGGFLLLSGYYSKDFEMIHDCVKEKSLTHLSNKEKNMWMASLFKK